MNSKTFCIVPWTQVRFDPNGKMSPCCKIDPNASNFNVHTLHNFDQYWNGDYLKQLRQDLGSGIRARQCKTCWQDEDAGKRSRRQETNIQLVKQTNTRDILKSKDWVSDRMPISLDLNLGNICNFKCVMCNPSFSSRIQSERKTHADKFIAIGLGNAEFDGSWPEGDFFQDFMKKVSPNLKLLELKGGEPLLVKNIIKTIQSVADKENATLSVTTNGSVELTPEFINEISKFEKIWMFVSLDGIGEEGEYVRHGSQWNVVEDTIHKVSKLDNCSFKLSVVLQFFSPVTFPKIFEFANKHNYDVSLINCVNPEYLGINAILPEHMKAFQQWAQTTAKKYPTLGYLNSLNGYLSRYEFDENLHQKCRNYINTLDGIRGNRLETIQNLFL